jgi:predicted MFS family arabinose efflux permease
MVILMAPLLVFVKPRLPIPAASAHRRIDVSFLRSPVFWVLQAFNIVQGTGYFLPSNYLPTYAQSLGIDSRLGSLTLVLANAAAMFGCVVVGALVDRVDVTNVVLGISIGAAIAVFAIWGVSTSLGVLCVFALLYGFTAGSYSSAWTGMIKDIQGRSTSADATVIFSFLAAGRGLGATVSGPLSEGLIAGGDALRSQAHFGYGGEYGTLIIFSGCTALVGGFSWIVRRFGMI